MGLLSAAAAIGLGLFAGAEERRFERAAAVDIGARLQGEGKVVAVNVRPRGLAAAWGELDLATIRAQNFTLNEMPLFVEPERSQAGKLGMLQLRLTDFQLRGLRVESLSADIPGCRYDFGLARRTQQIRVTRTGEGTGEVVVREADLAQYLVTKYREIKRATVRLDRGWVWVEGYGEFLIAKTEFRLLARLTPKGKRQLELTDAKIWFDGNRTDEFGRATLLRTLNPVVDLEKDLGLFDAVDVTHVETRDGVLRARGITRIPSRPKPSGPASNSGRL